MTHTIKITDEELWMMFQERGYTITITTLENGNKQVTFNHRFALAPYTLSRTYSSDWATGEIYRDCLQDLLRWSSLRLKATLDYF